MNDQRVTHCPHCRAAWIIEDDMLCNKCHRAIELEGEDAPELSDFIL